MREQPHRFARSTVAVVLCTALLLPAAAAAGKRPSLASTAQYKAFVDFALWLAAFSFFLLRRRGLADQAVELLDVRDLRVGIDGERALQPRQRRSRG